MIKSKIFGALLASFLSLAFQSRAPAFEGRASKTLSPNSHLSSKILNPSEKSIAASDVTKLIAKSVPEVTPRGGSSSSLRLPGSENWFLPIRNPRRGSLVIQAFRQGRSRSFRRSANNIANANLGDWNGSYRGPCSHFSGKDLIHQLAINLWLLLLKWLRESCVFEHFLRQVVMILVFALSVLLATWAGRVLHSLSSVQSAKGLAQEGH